MALSIRLHPEALIELNDASSYYGMELVDQLQRATAALAEMPRAWPLWTGSKKLRRRVLTRWPYAIVYMVTTEDIFVVAIEHTSRQPGYWLSRVQ